MSDQPSSEEMARLRALVPLHTLPDEALEELLETAGFESVAKGSMLFEEGDTDHENIYLLQGSVTLLNEGAIVDTVDAGSDTARFPLAHQLPRKYSARAKKKVRIARIDSRLLSDVLARTRTVDYQVADFEEATEDDWMSMLLQSSVLQQVPAANIQQVMINVEQVEVEKGADLICQGDPGDFYYMLTKGRAVVRRDNGDGKGPCELATLGPGDAFGEEALLSDNPRNSSVTMLQDGLVLRLSKDDFLDLIHNPLLDRLDMQAAQAKVDQGAVWLDLRSSEQFDASHLPGAINFPFESLRYQASSLVTDGHYVLCSDTGGRAMAGAFLLTERGIDVSVLEGGFPQDEAPEPAAEVRAEIMHSVPTSPDPAMQERIHEAELRAKELEERLKAVQLDQESVAAERQQNLQQVRLAVDQARRKLLETEEQKREALAAKQQAYAEMEQLTGNLEAIENERASLRDRMSEIEGLDKQLQSRLAKAERELIGERERAESATSSLEELSDRLSEILEKREQEREQHARERGELKEEMTALQMELEQAQLDLEELNESLAAREAVGVTDSEVLSGVQQRLADAEAGHQTLLAERDGLQQQLETAAAQAERLQASEQQLVELQQKLEDRERESAEATQALQSRIDGLAAEHGDLQQRLTATEEQGRRELALAEERAAKLDQALGEMENDSAESLNALQAELDAARAEMATGQGEAERKLEEAQNAADALRDELQGAIAEAQQEGQQKIDVLQSELGQLRTDNEALQAQLASGNEEAGAAIEQVQARAAELESRLDEEQRKAVQMTSAKQAELDAAETELQQLQAKAAADATALESAETRIAELQKDL
ncbi:MAG: cyclic nucleotide-binding domain-containing protein, partial [Sedimenticolaceae bacterium]